MSTTANQYQPDYAVPPGWVVADRLEAQRISQAEFARRCGRSPKLISQIISGEAPVEPDTALQFERVLGVNASIWLGIESDYRLHRQREKETANVLATKEWVAKFPVKELVNRGVITDARDTEEKLHAVLSFFGVGSMEAWESRQLQVAYRHSPSFKSDSAALATWLRLGEIAADQQDCARYNESRFKRALGSIRGLTATQSSKSLVEAQRLCQEAGVALTIVKPLSKMALSGASRWLRPDKAAIHLTARYMRDDQLWFSLFHEAGHLLLHSKRRTFIDERGAHSSPDEAEADRWAADFLVQKQDWLQFIEADRFDAYSVQGFARQQGIAPGIVVGRLQHEERVRWNSLNDLKGRLSWENVPPIDTPAPAA